MTTQIKFINYVSSSCRHSMRTNKRICQENFFNYICGEIKFLIRLLNIDNIGYIIWLHGRWGNIIAECRMKSKKNDNIHDKLDEYNDIIKKRAELDTEMFELKQKIQACKVKRINLDKNIKQIEIDLQADFYTQYNENDLLKMIPKVEKMATREVAMDFRQLVDKFKNHELETNDISQLHSYCKIYRIYIREDAGIIKELFKALGGNLDE